MMKFEQGEIYHIYNRGNFKQKTFLDDSHYWEFVKRMKTHIVPCCDLMAWSLMPNHFHFMVHCNEISVKGFDDRVLPIQKLSDSIRSLLGGYSKWFNSKMDRYGNLFRQKTKHKAVCDYYFPDFDITYSKTSYASSLFNYIHLNPVASKLVTNINDWRFSSFNEYAGSSKRKMCNKELTKRLIGIDETNFLQQTQQYIDHVGFIMCDQVYSRSSKLITGV